MFVLCEKIVLAINLIQLSSEKRKNSSLAKKKSFIGSAPGVDDSLKGAEK